jgi:hypothetical protein
MFPFNASTNNIFTDMRCVIMHRFVMLDVVMLRVILLSAVMLIFGDAEGLYASDE